MWFVYCLKTSQIILKQSAITSRFVDNWRSFKPNRQLAVVDNVCAVLQKQWYQLWPAKVTIVQQTR